MSRSKIAVTAGMAIAMFAVAGAVAQTAMKDKQVFHVSPKGTTQVLGVTAAGHDSIMKMGRELPAGVMIYRNGSKMYIIENQKMPNGKMAFEGTRAWFDQAVGDID